MSSEKTNKWYNNGLHFECTQCGQCCGGMPGYVWVTEHEIIQIAQYLEMPVEKFVDKYLKQVGRRLSLREKTKKENYDCIFLERTATTVKCKIYPVRPKQCRTWPFWKMNIGTPDDWLEANKRCPGINRGRLYSSDEIDKIAESSPC